MQDTTNETVTTIYCVCAEALQALGYEDDVRSKVSAAEIMLVPLVSALLHHSNHLRTRVFLKSHGYVPVLLSHSRYCRRVHQVPAGAWELVFALLSQVFLAHNRAHNRSSDSAGDYGGDYGGDSAGDYGGDSAGDYGGDYAVDSMPVLVCQNARISKLAASKS